MERHCPICGARVGEDMKICANCGKIIPPKRQASQGDKRAMPQGNRRPVQRQAQGNVSTQRQKAAAQSKPRVSQKPQAKVVKVSGKKKSGGFFDRFNLRKWLKAAVFILAIYLIISVVQIFRVRFSTYEFKSTGMKMSMDNYGEAIDGFFESGHWVYNPFTFTVKYSGETVEGDEYLLKFSAGGSVDIKAIEVDGEPKEEKQFETVVMGMFI